MKKQDVIKKIEDAVTEMNYKHFTPVYEFDKKWSFPYGIVDYVVDPYEPNIIINKDWLTIHFFEYADEFQKIHIYNGRKYKENQSVLYNIFYNLDTDSVNVFIQFHYSPTYKDFEIFYDTAKLSVEEIVEDYYSKLATLLKNEETKKNRINNRN